MYTSINNNLMAANTARNLNHHYANLATSTQRLSSGLRVNSSADDAAGLAIRELMRADIASFHQGARNANDAISMIQVADGSLGIIDEKLIRMKELAEQAATGTYSSTQRLMIDSEFQAMGAEIDRIANSTDFNGIKLLDGSRQGKHDGSGLESTGEIKIHFGSGNDSAEDYYYVGISDCTTRGLGLTDNYSNEANWDEIKKANWFNEATIDLENNKIDFTSPIINKFGGWGGSPYTYSGYNHAASYDYFILPKGLKNVTITAPNAQLSLNHHIGSPAHINIFTKDGIHLTGTGLDHSYTYTGGFDDPKDYSIIHGWENFGEGPDFDPKHDILLGKNNNELIFNEDAVYEDKVINNKGDTIEINGSKLTMVSEMQLETHKFYDPITGNEYWFHGIEPIDEVVYIDVVNEDFVILLGNYASRPFQQISISAEIADITNDKLISINTQEKAQQALTRIDSAIEAKDKVRANLGALQNRLENTISNLNIQAENLQASESRISDVDVATEMTNFVRNQILTQSAVAMLGQANSMPQIIMSLMQ